MAGTQGTMVEESSAIACGDGTTYCSESLRGEYEPVLRADPCAISTLSEFNTTVEDYVLWVPKYKRKACQSNAYQNCAADVERFGPRQVTQESFLQGRGQVTSNASCAAGGVRYLPKSEFSGEKPVKPSDMTLYAEPTKTPRSCGTLSEVDMQQRFDSLPGVWQGSWSPFTGMRFADDPQARPTLAGRARTSVTLGSKNKYPEWRTVKTQSEQYSQ